MNANDWTQILLYLIVLTALGYPLGLFMARVFEGTFAPLKWLERLMLRLCGVDGEKEMDWKQYALAMLWFNVLGILAVYVFQRVQWYLPLNQTKVASDAASGLTGVSPDSSFNTAISFGSNTNWQGYSGESTMTYLTQMLALTVQNFVSAATGIAVLIALIRGLARAQTSNLGNFWVDLWRSTFYVLMPLSFVFALILIQQGVPQTLAPYRTVTLVQPTTFDNPVNGPDGQPLKDEKGNPKTEKAKLVEQTVALGPVASQIAIKQLGTNGGGFFNANSAHPYENPTPLTNFLEVLAILGIAVALCFTFGAMLRDMRQGWAIYAAMMLLLVVPLVFCVWCENAGNPGFKAFNIEQSAGNMEGKETRFGVVNSAIWATTTTAASNGSVNSMHDSFTPLGGFVPMWMMKLGEVVFGGVGSGLYGMLIFAIVTVFIAGLMVGRTPEYLGKKIEAFEMKMASLVILIPPLTVVISTAIAVLWGPRDSLSNPGAHGFSEMLYACTSASNNNGSAFAGLNANVPFYNIMLGICMLLGRYWLAVPVLAIAGALAKKKRVPAGAGTLPTHTPLFVIVLVAVVTVVGALAFIPSLSLGPIVEHLQMYSAK